MDKIRDTMRGLTYAHEHNPNCPMPHQVRLVGVGKSRLDLLPRGRTSDILGTGKSFSGAARSALDEKDIKTFKNPRGIWSYVGGYTIRIHNATIDNLGALCLPKGATLDGQRVTVPRGRVLQATGGIEFHSATGKFHFDCRYIVWIRDDKGQLLWVNDNYRLE